MQEGLKSKITLKIYVLVEPGCSIKNAREGTDLLSQGLAGETMASSGKVIIPPSIAETPT